MFPFHHLATVSHAVPLSYILASFMTHNFTVGPALILVDLSRQVFSVKKL